MKIKDKPDIASRIYGFDMKHKLRTGETLTGGSAQVRTGDVVAQYQSVSGTKVLVRLSGGTKGADCQVMISATTSAGDTIAESIFFSIIG